jgi:hypothetical protein
VGDKELKVVFFFVIGSIGFMGFDITSMAWLKSNTMLNYWAMMISFWHIKPNRCII